MGGGVPEPVWPEGLDSGTLGASAQGTAESVPAELLPAVAEPQFGTRREWMLLAVGEVDQERRFGGRVPDRNHPTASAPAAPDGDEPGDEVEVVELQVDELAGADGGLEHEPDDGLVATVVEGVLGSGVLVGDGAGGYQCTELGVGEWLDQRRFVSGCLDAGEGVGVELAAGSEPGREAAYGELANAGGARDEPPSSNPAIHELSEARLIGR